MSFYFNLSEAMVASDLEPYCDLCGETKGPLEVLGNTGMHVCRSGCEEALFSSVWGVREGAKPKNVRCLACQGMTEFVMPGQFGILHCGCLFLRVPDEGSLRNVDGWKLSK